MRATVQNIEIESSSLTSYRYQATRMNEAEKRKRRTLQNRAAQRRRRQKIKEQDVKWTSEPFVEQMQTRSATQHGNQSSTQATDVTLTSSPSEILSFCPTPEPHPDLTVDPIAVCSKDKELSLDSSLSVAVDQTICPARRLGHLSNHEAQDNLQPPCSPHYDTNEGFFDNLWIQPSDMAQSHVMEELLPQSKCRENDVPAPQSS